MLSARDRRDDPGVCRPTPGVSDKLQKVRLGPAAAVEVRDDWLGAGSLVDGCKLTIQDFTQKS